MKRPPLVEVTWVDACFHSRTFGESNLHRATLVTRHTAGFLIRRDPRRRCIYIAHTIDDDDQGGWEYDGVFTIPTAWVRKISRKRREH